MRETATGMAAAANVPAILRPHRPASKEGAAPPPVTAGSQERGHDQGTVRAAGGFRTGRAQGAGSAAPRLSTETRQVSDRVIWPGRAELPTPMGAAPGRRRVPSRHG